MIKHQYTPKPQIRSELKCLKTLRPDSVQILNKHLFMLGTCASYDYLLSISGHFKRFRLNDQHFLKYGNIEIEGKQWMMGYFHSSIN